MVNFLQITAIAISINVNWSTALITMFETAGQTVVRIFMNLELVTCRVYWRPDFRSDRSISQVFGF